MNIRKRLAAVVLCVVLAGSGISAGSVKAEAASTTKISLIKGETKKLTAVKAPVGKTITFLSGNKKIAKVSSKGLITAVKAGTTTITASVGTQQAKFQVTVLNKLKLTRTKLTIERNSTKKVKAVKPWKAKDLTFKSSNKKVATVSAKGKVKAKLAGTVKITVTAGTQKVSCTVKVTDPNSGQDVDISVDGLE